MFAKLKKKIADEAATGPRPGGPARMPRSISKESVTSTGADSGDDFPSDGSSSREDLSSQLFRRNEHIRKLEVKLSDYAEQVRNLQKIKEKLENALETHQDSFVKKLQEQNETHQTSIAKMAEGMTLALEKKDQEWREKLSHLEKEKKILSAQLQEMREQSLNLFQKRDDIEELEGFQQQELAKVKHMLLKKEEFLAQMERELGSSTQELFQAREELQASQAFSSRLSREAQELLEQQKNLEMERDELRDAGERAENKTTLLEERSHELQALIQRLSVDLQKAQLAASSSEKRLEMLQGDHESLKLEFEEQKQKMVAEVEDKRQLVGHLQEKVATLEKRFEGSLSGDEHFRELFKEKSALEQRLEDTRQQFLAAQSSHKESLCLMETQINQLNSRLAMEQALLGEKEESLQILQESSLKQQQDLERALQLAREATMKCQGDIKEKELQVQKLQTDLELERIRSQEGFSSAQAQWTGEIGQLQEQVAALEAARTLEREAGQQLSRQLENENADLKVKHTDLERALRNQETELEGLKTELRNKAEMTQTLEVVWKEKEALQQQVANLTSSLQQQDQLIVNKTDTLLKQEEEAKSLRQAQDTLLLQVHQLQSSLELCQRQAAEKETAMQEQLQAFQAQLQEQQERLLASEKQAAVLELASIALEDQLHLSEDGEAEPNGELASSDIIQLQEEKRDLEQHIAEKNKMIKQLQQRMAELKKTLQKELKIRPDGEVTEGPTAALTVTNNSDLNDSREINFEYLKHVVLKFMSCRESEALHLIKALSVLLNFSREEENMLRETLEYKMSWFGSKPPPRGSIRPSISSPRTPWS